MVEKKTCLAITNPELAAEWHPTKNDNLTPNDVSAGSGKKVWWLGKCGHEWQATILNRKNGTKCAVCGNRRVLVGYNDLTTTNPELAAEWHPFRNGKLTPEMVFSGSHQKVWWLGKCGHEWHASIGHRQTGEKCPICRKEQKTSFPEQAIFYYLQKIYPDAANGNMHIGMELDIYIPSIKTAIEYDGLNWHSNQVTIQKEKKKNILCINESIKLIRIREYGLSNYSNCICINRKDNSTNDSLQEVIIELLRILNIDKKIKINIDKDANVIFQQYISSQKENSLAAKNKEITLEWHPIKNGNLKPCNVTTNSAKKVWWLGKCGHEWQAVISSRNKGIGCPICKNLLILPGFNDMATKNPKLAEEWHPIKNENLKANNVTTSSAKKVWWLGKCGHEWQATVSNRNKGSNCPICSNFKILPGFNDLATTNAESTMEWHPTKNGELTPMKVSSGSDKKVWWLGKCGHEWQATISNRIHGKNCPICSGRKILPGFNDLATTNVELTMEWHPTKNDELTPLDITSRCGKKIWWLGKCGHEWQARVDGRNNGVGCPYCSNKRALQGYNDLATTNPQLAAEWHPTKNGDLTPRIVTAGSDKKVWWLGKCGHEWQANIFSRNQGYGCKICGHKKTDI